MSALVPSRARKEFGFDSIALRASRVEECIKEAQTIRESIDKIATIRDKALLITLGLQDCEPCLSDNDSSCDSDSESKDSVPISLNIAPSIYIPPPETLKYILDAAQYNWFQVIQSSKIVCGADDFRKVYSKSLDLPMSIHQRNLLERSFASYEATLPEYSQIRDENALNGEIVSDSDCDDSEDYVGITFVQSEMQRNLLKREGNP